MQENNFEKRVQEQMEELRFRPSDAVWEKVEEEIRRKKKRRVVFFIFLLAALSLLGYSGYFLFNKSKSNLVEQNSTLTNQEELNKNDQPGNNNKSVNNETEKITNSKKKPVVTESEVSTLTEKETPIKEKAGSIKTTDIVSTDKQTKKQDVAIVEGHEKQKRISKPAISEKLVVKTKNKRSKSSSEKISKEPVQPTDKLQVSKDDAGTPVIIQADVSQPDAVAKTLVEDKQPADPVVNAEAKKDSIAEDSSVKKEEIVAAIAKPKKKQLPKINWGLELSYGISANREDAFSFFDGGQKSMDALYNAPQGSIGVPINSQQAPVFYSPSSIKAGSAFRAGLVGEMQLSRRSSVSSGLRYAYFSNSIKVGAYKDTAVSFTNSFSQDVRTSAIYRGISQKEYTNRFHFIQLPLQYHLQLNKGVKVPILWTVGATVGYLISTNGLVYDTAASGIYYHDKKAFNKFNWNLNTGFSFKLGNKNKLQWSLGPEISLGMNKLTKGDTRKQYLLYGGVTGRIIFTKKK
jgi:hypothetical protein